MERDASPPPPTAPHYSWPTYGAPSQTHFLFLSLEKPEISEHTAYSPSQKNLHFKCQRKIRKLPHQPCFLTHFYLGLPVLFYSAKWKREKQTSFKINMKPDFLDQINWPWYHCRYRQILSDHWYHWKSQLILDRCSGRSEQLLSSWCPRAEKKKNSVLFFYISIFYIFI